VGQPLNILVVDDSTMMRAMIKRAIQMSGVEIGEIYEAPDGQAALALLERHKVDALFTDINMPIMSGTELLRVVAARGWTHIVRVIVSTDGSAARREEVRDLDVRLYVDKPFAPEVIRDVLSELCNVAAAR
jgi:two-component system chemotaxis response regulator CheY